MTSTTEQPEPWVVKTANAMVFAKQFMRWFMAAAILGCAAGVVFGAGHRWQWATATLALTTLWAGVRMLMFQASLHIIRKTHEKQMAEAASESEEL